MSRHDSQPPMADFPRESRPCPCFERPDRITVDHNIPSNITLGAE